MSQFGNRAGKMCLEGTLHYNVHNICTQYEYYDRHCRGGNFYLGLYIFFSSANVTFNCFYTLAFCQFFRAAGYTLQCKREVSVLQV